MLGNEQSGPGGCSRSILRARKMREDLRVSGWGFRLKRNETEKEGEAGCQRLCAPAEQLKFISNYFQVPTAVST